MNQRSAARTDLPETPVHQSLVRPVLLAGAERELAAGELLGALFIVGAAGPNVYSLIGITLIVTLHFGVLVPAAKVDPNLGKAYFRHILYRKGYFPAQPGLGAPASQPPGGR